MRTWGLRALGLAGGALLMAGTCQAWAQTAGAHGSAHYNDAGFFDIHVCNWPNRPVFLMALFSTTRFSEIAGIEVFDPEHRLLAKLDLGRYRLVQVPGKPEKRVFISQITMPQKPADGWYSTRVTMRSGKHLGARDYVAIGRLPRATNMIPAADTENMPLPQELKWGAVPGARFYQVFIKDLWDGERLIYTSAFLDKPRLALPAGLLQPGGAYAWRVHARDVNEDPKLGDFNIGSLSPEIKFSVAQ